MVSESISKIIIEELESKDQGYEDLYKKYPKLAEELKEGIKNTRKEAVTTTIQKLKEEFKKEVEVWHKICSDIAKKEIFKSIEKIK